MIKYLVICLVFIPNNEVTSKSLKNAKTTPGNVTELERSRVTDNTTTRTHGSRITKSLTELAREKQTLNTKHEELSGATGSTQSSSLLPTLPYPIGTMDAETNNRTAELIRLISKINVKQIIPLVVNPGMKQPVVSGLKTRRFLEDDEPGLQNRRLGLRRSLHHEKSLSFLLQPHLSLKHDKEERRYLISNPEVIQKYISRRRRKKERSTSSSSEEDLEDFRRQGDQETKPVGNLGVFKNFISRRRSRRKKKKPQSTSSSSEDSELDLRKDEDRRHIGMEDNSKKKHRKKSASHKSRRKHKKKKKKKHRSTSSSSSGDDLDFRRQENRRMAYPPYKTLTSESEELERRAQSGEEMEKNNYDDRSDDYVITTKKGVWDYEHENWAVITKKLNWDGEETSVEFNQSISEHNKDEKRNPKEYSDDEKKEILTHVEEEHKKFNIKHHKQYPDSGVVAKDENDLESEVLPSDNEKLKPKSFRESKTQPEYSHEKIRNSEHVKKKHYSEEYRDDSWSKKQKTNSRENRDSGRIKRKERYDEYASRQINHSVKNKTRQWRDDNSRERFKQKKSKRERYHSENKRDGYRSDRTTKGNTDRLVDNWMQNKDKKHKHADYADDRDDKDDYRKKKLQRYSDSRYADDDLNNHHKKRDYISNERYDTRDKKEKILKKDNVKSNSREEMFDADDNKSDDKYEDHKRVEKTTQNYKRNTFETKNRFKKSHLRQAEIEKEWGTAKKVDWGSHDSREDWRSNKKGWGQYTGRDEDVSKNNEHYSYVKPAKEGEKKAEQKKKKNTVRFEDFWNRHAHNQWDKVGADWGVDKKSQKVQKNRVPSPIRTTGNKDIWDRHGNNDWDKVGRHEDYKDRITYDTKPQSHRSQNSGSPVYFGYVHTPLPFKGKKTVFDE